MTRGCLAGSSVCFVSHVGEVYPCGYLPVSAGSTRRERFADIWEQSPVFERLRTPDAYEGKCGICRFEAICGGCRARAYAETGNFMAEEPYCTYQPGLAGGERPLMFHAAP
jgi:radical SAM protein with 4Fe4S-binding SPASM domain